MLAWDTETDLMGPCNLAPDLACVTWSDGDQADIVHWQDAEPILRWLLEQETYLANAAYDLAVAWANFPGLRDLIWDALDNNRVHDVLIRQKLLDIGEGVYRRVYRKFDDKTHKLGYSLSDLHARYFGSFLEKDEWRLQYGRLRKLPLHQWDAGAIHYAQHDAKVTAWVGAHQDVRQIKMRREPREYLHDEPYQVRAAWALHLMSCWGFAIDLKQLKKVLGAIEEEQPQLARKLEGVGLVRPNGTRNEKLAKRMMWESVGVAGELTDTGYKKVKAKLLTKEQALEYGYIKIDEEWCEVSENEYLKAYYHYRQNQLLTAKLSKLQSGLPIQTQFDSLMDTGRTSSSANKLIVNSAALQNLPRKPGMRECFVAREGCTLAACDYGQAELVSLAQVTYSAFGHSKMRDIINEGRDLHLDFGLDLYKKNTGNAITYQQAVQLQKLKDKLVKDARQASKSAMFGFPGGLGAESFRSYARKSWGLPFTLEESQDLRKRWLIHFPEMREYFRWISRLLEANGGKLDIQQLVSNRWRGACRYTQACNGFFQSLTADAAKAAMYEVSRLCYTVKSSPLYGCRPVLFVHDELIVEMPLEQAAEAARELERVMVSVYQRYTPDVRITADAHLMQRWSKDAEATWDARGKLIPWVPYEERDYAVAA